MEQDSHVLISSPPLKNPRRRNGGGAGRRQLALGTVAGLNIGKGMELLECVPRDPAYQSSAGAFWAAGF